MIVQENTVEHAIAMLNAADMIALDTETNITDTMHDRYPLGFSAATVQETYYFPLEHKKTLGHQNLAVDSVNSLQPKHIIWHNAKFDRQVFKKINLDFDAVPFDDTMLLSYVLDENPPHKLKELGEKFVRGGSSNDQQIVKALTKGFTWEGIFLEIMAQYAETDARLTFDLFDILTLKFKKYNGTLDEIYANDLQLCNILQGIEEIGITIDVVEARLKGLQCLHLLKDMKEKLGYDPGKPSQLIPRLFDVPPIGLGLKPIAYGVSGKPSTGVEVLEEYHHPEVAQILHFRRIKKAMTSYYESWPKLTDSTGTLHPTFHQHSTLTGRLSCSDPNMHQIPRDTDENETKSQFPVKKLVRARSGWQVWELDYDQQELRLASVYAEEHAMLAVFRAGNDPHQLMADTLHVTRFIGKQVNFLLPYGGGAYKLFTTIKKLAPQVSFTISMAESIHQQYHETYPGFRRIAYKCAGVMEQQGYIEYWSGRRRRMAFDQHKTFNSLIQGGCADITRESMLKIHELELQDTRMVNQVHDSIWIETRNVADIELVRQTMEWPTLAFGLPFSVGVKRLA